jgi:hypothetical protein
VLVLAAVGISTFASFSLQKTPNPTELSQEELARMVKPSVVRIAQHVTGTYSLPEFKIDLEHLTTTITGQTKNEKLDEYITGTGFAVNPNGYIITNSHVVSKESVKAFLLDDAYTQSFEDAMADYSKEELQKLLEKELVSIAGRSEGPGRPLLYATSEKFMDYLGIRSLHDLPKPKDFKEVENIVGEAPALEEFVPASV